MFQFLQEAVLDRVSQARNEEMMRSLKPNPTKTSHVSSWESGRIYQSKVPLSVVQFGEVTLCCLLGVLYVHACVCV